MNSSTRISLPQIFKKNIASILIDAAAIAFIYFVPALTHLMSFPLYLIEPMRIMVILAMVHTNRHNAIFLAVTLPFFSYLISGHPMIIKTGLIAAELIINVILFYSLIKYIQPSIALFTSILLSKAVYYGMKYLSIILFLPGDTLVSTPIYIQLITTLLFSLYVFLFFKNKNYKHFY